MDRTDAATTFHRPPREYPPAVPREPLRLAPPPNEPAPVSASIVQTLFPVVGGVGIFGFALIYGSSAFLFVALAMTVLLLLFSVLLRWSQRRQVRKRAAADARRYAAYLRERDQELAEAGDRQRAALARLYPEPGRLWTMAVRREGVWERRSDDEDFLHVRLGTGTVPLDRPIELDLGFNPLTEYQSLPLHEARRLVDRRGTLRNQPVTADVNDVGVLAVTGDRRRARAWARGLAAQLATFRSPRDLKLACAFDPAAEGEWSWMKWLPHARVESLAAASAVPVPTVALARDPGELAALLDPEVSPRLEQLRRMAEADLAGRVVGLVEPELVLIVDGFHPSHPINGLPHVRELLGRARELRALVVLLCDDRALEPSRIDARLSVPARGPARFEHADRDGEALDEIAPDAVDVGSAEAIARTLAPLRLAEGGDGKRGLGDTVRLVDLLGLPSAAAVDPRGIARRPRRHALRVPIAIGADGDVVELDLKQAAEDGMGPHGVLVGATGSGKSELLRSIVAGLAATHDPETLSFVLVDYKGGAAFAELSRLPHVAGLITNLQRDLSLVDRMHDALLGEQERRQAMLRDAGNLDDAVAYRAAREARPDLPPMPDLLVIVDEFAELLAARPDFIDVFVGIGRVGRSLGIHLLLSSQRLEEGRLRGLESHLRYRICLRTYSATESKLVLGTPDAYLLPSLPGLGYLKVDTTVYRQFRAALATTPYCEPGEPAAPVAEVHTFDPRLPASEDETAASDTDERVADRAPTDLDVLVDRLAHADAGAVHQIWVPPLSAALALDALDGREPEAPGGLRVAIGLLDLPTEQRTAPLTIEFGGAGGHVAVVGAPRTGKSTALRTLLAALIRDRTPAEARIYAIDLGGGLLSTLAGAPHVGGVVGKLDAEAVHRVVRQLRTELEERERRFADLRLESMAAARVHRDPAGGPDDLADVFLVVDGWHAFRREFEGLDREIEELAGAGLAYGIHVVVSATRWAEIRPALLDNLGTRLELKLNDPIDSLVSRQAAAALAADVPGRALTSDGHHAQLALPRADGVAGDDGLREAVEALAAAAAERWHGPPAEPIRLLPRELRVEQLPPPRRGAISAGIDERHLEPFAVDLFAGDPHLLVFGDAEAGKTSFARLLARGLADAYDPHEVRMVVADVRRGLGDLEALPHVGAVVSTGQALEQEAMRLASGLAARVAAGRMEPGDQRHVVVVDDYDLLAGPAASPLGPLLDLLALGRDIGLHVVLIRRVGGSARAQYESVFARVRELGSPGLVLSGDPGEGPLLGGVKAQPQPAGRGVLVRAGRRPATVQLAFVLPSAAPTTEPVPVWTDPGAR